MKALALAAAGCAAMNGLLGIGRPLRALPPLRLSEDSAVESAALFSLGMRRLEADLGLVRLLIYYGTPELEEAAEEGHDHAHERDPGHPERGWGGGRYAELSPRAKLILDIDPGWAYPVLFSSGALAFNLNRPDEALELLAYALKRDPHNPKYRAYAAAIGFHRKGDSAAVIRLLEPVLAEPDCPTMLKSMIAFLYRKSGRREKAAALYREILETSRDPGYRAVADRALKTL